MEPTSAGGDFVVEAKLEQGLAGLRAGFQADGADLRLVGWKDGVAEVELVLGPEACLECIVPTDLLTAIVERALKDQVPQVQAVIVKDPR